jgi:uncharacterized protein YlxP (DUF503 family)
MRVGTILIELRLPHPSSLKEKRAILKGLMAKVKREFNVSVAEVGELDDRRRAELGAALVSNDGGFSDRVLAKVVQLIEQQPQIEIEDYRIEIL